MALLLLKDIFVNEYRYKCLGKAIRLIVNTIWIGGELGPIHAACLRSFVREGHDVVLHSYARPHDTPDGVRLFDASKLMKEEEIVLHKKTGSLTLAADRYRYRILREGMGLYVDCDVYCLQPFPQDQYVFGWEDDDTINNAVLNMPHDSALLKHILKASEDSFFIPPWRSKNKIRYARLRKAIGLPIHVSKQKWGTIGPRLISYCAKELGLEDKASPLDIFYPVYFKQLDLLYERGLTIADITTPRTLGVHLYNSLLKDRSVVAGSPLHAMLTA